MYQLIYTSQAVIPFTDEALTALLRQSLSWNEQEHITGVLLYSDEHFVQVLEGEEAAVRDLYGKIQHDVRHHSLTLLASGPVAQRRFAQWLMAFQAVEPAHMARVRGYLTPERLELHYHQHAQADELLLQLIESFLHNPLHRL